MECYKITRNKRSLAAGGKAGVIYSVNKYVKARRWLAKQGYHLLAFETLTDAVTFINEHVINNEEMEIWRAIGRTKVALPKFCDIEYLDDGVIKYTENNWAQGTVMFKEIKLIEKIEKFWED